LKKLHTGSAIIIWLDDNNLIYKHQYGFRSKHSTQSLLIKLQNVLFKAKSRKKQVLAIYVDIQKAFEYVNHEILLDKIEHYKQPCKWFESDLKQRRQYTCVGGVKSSLLDVIYGVAQGSIIG
jgi:retron-type reverse transcriptase